MSKYEMYRCRGPDLKFLSFYVYTAIIGTKNIKPKKPRTTPSSAGGRPSSKTYPFTKNSNASKCKVQIIMSCPKIPRVVGAWPPAYPGNLPSQGGKELEAWSPKAKEFVEYYSLLFLPLNSDGYPFDPTTKEHDIHILPWKGQESWNIFWRVFGSWDVQTYGNDTVKLFKRSMWQIFTNMVDNLRQTQSERGLLTNWRLRAADPRPNDVRGNNDLETNRQNSTDQQDSEQNDAAAIIEVLRAKQGAIEFLSKGEKAQKEAKKYLETQMRNLKQLYNCDLPSKRRQKFPKFDLEKVNLLLKRDTDEKNSILGQKQKSKKSKKSKPLYTYQKTAVTEMRKAKYEKHTNASVKPNQLLVYLQGTPGSGKTLTAKGLEEAMPCRALFTATTHAAANKIGGQTINSALKLGRNETYPKLEPLKSKKRLSIQNNFCDIDLLVIDEVSMLTPMTLARIDFYLREAFESEWVFGGKDVLLIGDMWQLIPVEKYMHYPALYQAVVRVARGLYSRNAPYNIGANLFTLFKKITLNGQSRAKPAYDL
ncbi:MAG: AAA family ATPase, partial [Colwellia sp.]|nr:AAA family ATPase [Colwellia sp.]